MKHTIPLILSAALLLSALCACGSADADPSTTVIPPDPTEGAAATLPADATQEPSLAPPSEEPSEEVSAEPSAEPSQEPTQAPATQAPATQAPTARPTPSHHPEETHHVEPTHHPEETHHVDPTHHPEETHHVETTPEPTPTSAPEVSGVDFERFFNTLAGRYGFPENMMQLGIDVANNFYPGLAGLDLDQCAYYIPATTGGANVTELVLIQAANPSDAAAAAAILQARIDRQLGPGSMLYPQDRVAWTDHSRVTTNGSFAMLVVNQNCDAIVADFNALF